MGMSSYLQEIRGLVGHRLLLLPSVTVLPRDADGRILLVRQANPGGWGTIGGAIEPDESPAEAAVREAKEEASVDVALGPVIAVQGGPGFRVTYANGDEAAYISIVYDATITNGTPEPDGDETLDVGWFTRDDLQEAELSTYAQVELRDLGFL
jgi:ADP-ribose pyrophosphatase YjhB (NUDIX family)